MTATNITWRGDYSLIEIYTNGDVVLFGTFGDNKEKYICLVNESCGIPPYLRESGFEIFDSISTVDFSEITFINGGYF